MVSSYITILLRTLFSFDDDDGDKLAVETCVQCGEIFSEVCFFFS